QPVPQNRQTDLCQVAAAALGTLSSSTPQAAAPRALAAPTPAAVRRRARRLNCESSIGRALFDPAVRPWSRGERTGTGLDTAAHSRHCAGRMNSRVDLPDFHGPLDLLLYLVKKNEVDVREIPIAKVAAQFQEYL